MKKILIVMGLLCLFGGCASINAYIADKKEPIDVKAQRVVDEEIPAILNQKNDEYSYAVHKKNINSYEELYKGFIESISNQFSDVNVVISKNLQYPKQEAVCNYMLYNDLSLGIKDMAKTISDLQNKVCSKDFVYIGNKRSDTRREALCLNNNDYKDFITEYTKRKQVADSIYNNAYEKEANVFIKKFGFDLNEKQALIETLLNYPGYSPSKDYVYILDNVKVMQNVSDGLLVQGDHSLYYGQIYPDKIAMIYTNKKFPDGTSLGGQGVVRYVGNYEYVSTLGAKKVVSAYKLIDTNSSTYQNVLKNFYFYPSIKDKDDFAEENESMLYQHLAKCLGNNMTINGKTLQQMLAGKK